MIKYKGAFKFKCPLKYVKAVRYGEMFDLSFKKRPWPVDAWRDWYIGERRKRAAP